MAGASGVETARPRAQGRTEPHAAPDRPDNVVSDRSELSPAGPAPGHRPTEETRSSSPGPNAGPSWDPRHKARQQYGEPQHASAERQQQRRQRRCRAARRAPRSGRAPGQARASGSARRHPQVTRLSGSPLRGGAGQRGSRRHRAGRREVPEGRPGTDTAEVRRPGLAPAGGSGMLAADTTAQRPRAAQPRRPEPGPLQQRDGGRHAGLAGDRAAAHARPGAGDRPAGAGELLQLRQHAAEHGLQPRHRRHPHRR